MDRSLSLQRRELRKKAKELQEVRDFQQASNPRSHLPLSSQAQDESALARDQAADLVIKVRRLQQSLDQARATAVTSELLHAARLPRGLHPPRDYLEASTPLATT